MLSTRVAALRCIMLLQRAGQQQFQHSSQGVPQFQQLITALLVAAAQQPSRSNNPAVSQKYLLAAGAAVNAANKTGRTPLHLAAAVPGARESVVERLLAAGASASAADKASHTPLLQLLGCQRQ